MTSTRKILVGTVVASVGVVVGAALPVSIGSTDTRAQAEAAAPAEMQQTIIKSPTVVSKNPRWSRNAAGQTYGFSADIVDWTDAPDLVSVWVTSDTVGYIPSEYVFPDISTLTREEAIASSTAARAQGTFTVAATDLDGNVIGQFEVGGN